MIAVSVQMEEPPLACFAAKLTVYCVEHLPKNDGGLLPSDETLTAQSHPRLQIHWAGCQVATATAAGLRITPVRPPGVTPHSSPANVCVSALVICFMSKSVCACVNQITEASSSSFSSPLFFLLQL